MINPTSLEAGLIRSLSTYSAGGPFTSFNVTILYQDPLRPFLTATVAADVFTCAAIAPLENKRVTIQNDPITYFMVAVSGNSFQLATERGGTPSAFGGVSYQIKDADISANDDLEVLNSYFVAGTNPSFSLNSYTVVEDPKVTRVTDYYYLSPTPNLSHILILLADENTFEPNPYPNRVYGLVNSSVSTVPNGQNLRMSIKAYIKNIYD